MNFTNALILLESWFTTIYSKKFEEENFRGFHSFSVIANVFPRIMALSISNVSLQEC